MRRDLWRAAAVLVPLGAFATLITVAVGTYPGGNWREPAAPRFDVVDNFFCDLLAVTTAGGRPNPVASRAAPLAMMALALAVGAALMQLPRLYGASLSRTWARATRALSLAALPGMVGVALTPSAEWQIWHSVAIAAGGGPGLSALAVAVLGLFRGDPGSDPLVVRVPGRRGLAWLGAATLAAGLVDGIVYGWQILHPSLPAGSLLPAMQKVAALLLFVWLALIARALANVGAPTPTGRG